MKHLVVLAAGTVALSACALKGDVRRVEAKVDSLRVVAARADSAQAALLDQVLALQGRFIDSLTMLQRRLTTFQGDVRSDMTDVQRQLVQLQELSGQSQQRLSDLRGQLQDRLQEGALPPIPSAGNTPAGRPAPGAAAVDAQQIFELSLQQLRRGSPQTARVGFRKVLDDFPRHPRAADAQFFIGESWEDHDLDSAATAYEQIVSRFPDARHAPTALYRLGLIAERRGNQRAAQLYYQRVIAGYPRSEEAQLARTKLNTPDD